MLPRSLLGKYDVAVGRYRDGKHKGFPAVSRAALGGSRAEGWAYSMGSPQSLS